MNDWPLRARESLLDRALGVTEGGRSVVFRGDAGVGKTRLARHTSHRLSAAGCRVVWASATRAVRAVPFGIFASHLDGLSEQDPHPLRLFLRIADRLAAKVSGQPPVVIAVDDAHLLDESSAALLHQLASTNRCQLLLTVRRDEPVSDAVSRLWRDGYADSVQVGPFDLDGVREVLEGALDGQVDALTAERLRWWTGGNALYLRELVSAGIDAGRLRRVGAVWRWIGGPVAAHGLHELVRDRFAGLTADELAAVRLVALGEPVEAEVICECTEWAVVDGLCRRGLLVEREAMLRLPHPLHAEVLVAEISSGAAAVLRRRLLAALPHDGSPAALLRRVVLRLDAGDQPDDDELLTAADYALNMLDAPLAERLASAARVGSVRRLVTLARAHTRQGRPERAEELLARFDSGSAAEDELVTLIGARVDNLVMELGRPEEALHLLEGDAARAMSAELSTRRVLTLAYLGRYGEAHQELTKIVSGAGSHADLPPVAVAAGGVMLIHIGRHADALRLARAMSARVPHDDPVDRLALQIVEIGAHLYSGDLDRAEQVAESLRQWGLRQRWPAATAYGTTFLGQVYAARGRYRQAAALLRDSVGVASEHDPFGGTPMHLSVLGMCEAACGDLATARAAIDDAIAARGQNRLSIELDLLCQAFVLACEGRMVQARQHLRAMSEHCAGGKSPDFGIAGLHLMARLGQPVAALKRLPARLGELESTTSKTHVRYIQALAGQDSESILELSHDYERHGMWHLAAEAAGVAADRMAGRRPQQAARAR
ncbi:AAA family ATPase, partial [Allorhizocola rhizosphaerae]|uniref:AAA family ATPase n=1 Tax=Allorhizocola rhizosphaerae TaxID=1872709 RepID=UPI0013C36529